MHPLCTLIYGFHSISLYFFYFNMVLEPNLTEGFMKKSCLTRSFCSLPFFFHFFQFAVDLSARCPFSDDPFFFSSNFFHLFQFFQLFFWSSSSSSLFWWCFQPMTPPFDALLADLPYLQIVSSLELPHPPYVPLLWYAKQHTSLAYGTPSWVVLLLSK